jgi:SAM-dependent methyltransferase/glycosyltransferase involved in cell wall biosynthesis
MDICTIIAKNYVAQARVLARSFAEHHAEGRCFVLVIDEYDGYLDPASEPFTILTPAQIDCAEFGEMALRYDVLELSTAVKPWLLAHLLSEASTSITYLDPDIRIHSSLVRLEELAEAHGVVLTPHNTTPLPDDGERPSQIDILLAGVYNLGYVSLGAGEETDTLLRWWRERLLTDCRVDPRNGYFVDQRWFDLAPGLVADHAIVREPQYNLAYWNLHDRDLKRYSSGYTVDGKPLAFIHFSGFDPQAPETLSRHQTRVSLEEKGALAQICLEYADEVNAAGYGQAKDWPYTFNRLPSGVEFSRILRKLYGVAHDDGELTQSPFTPIGEQAFLRWLTVPPPQAGPGLNRVLAELHGTRADLQQAFPEVHTGDYRAFLHWARDVGVNEEPALGTLVSLEERSVTSEQLVAAAPREVAAESAPPDPTQGSVALITPRAPAWGVNVVGYFRSELGTGEAARQVVSALDACGVPLLPVHGRMIPPNRQGHSFAHLDYTDARYPVNLICMNADMLGGFAAEAGAAFFDNRYSIGLWFWEVEKFPDDRAGAFDHIDELWLPTDHMVRAIGQISSVPVTKITLPVEMPPVLPASRAELELPEGFMFLFSFDHHSVFERKNPLATVEAYTRAFDPGDGAVLVVKSINAESAPKDHARLLAAAAGRPDVHIIDGYLSPEHKNMMVAACDCYVSLHRAEGFGFTMAEAMYLDKPVVATAYSGNLDFMNEHGSFLVDYRMVDIGPDAAPYPADGKWAEPDIEHAARLMREVFEQPHQATERAQRGGREIRSTHSAQAAGEIMRRRLDLLHERHGLRLAQIAISHPPTEQLEQRVRSGPLRSAGAPLRRIRLTARRLILRLMKPYTAYQQDVNRDLAKLLSGMEARIATLDIVAAERHAALLADSRADRLRPVWEHIAGLSRAAVGLERVLAEDIPKELQRIDRLAGSVQHLEWESHAIPYMENSPFHDITHPAVGVVQGYRRDADVQAVDVYRSFEDTFRGSEELIRGRQRIFFELLGDREPVLDFGCGRGEFLDLLTEHGVAYLGVDSDAGMVRRCRAKGHAGVVEADGLEYLAGLEDGSLGAIFCAQVIEHLPYGALLRLLSLARQKLREDGILIAETVNPHCPTALKTFWVDPTHQHPIFPEVALQLCGSEGFSAAFVFHPNGTGDVTVDRFTQGEYALVAGGQALLPEPRFAHRHTVSSPADSDPSPSAH